MHQAARLKHEPPQKLKSSSFNWNWIFLVAVDRSYDVEHMNYKAATIYYGENVPVKVVNKREASIRPEFSR